MSDVIREIGMKMLGILMLLSHLPICTDLLDQIYFQERNQLALWNII